MSDVPPDEKTLLERIRGSWPENPLKRGLLRALLTCFLSGGVWMTHRLVAPTDFQMYNTTDRSQRALLGPGLLPDCDDCGGDNPSVARTADSSAKDAATKIGEWWKAKTNFEGGCPCASTRDKSGGRCPCGGDPGDKAAQQKTDEEAQRRAAEAAQKKKREADAKKRAEDQKNVDIANLQAAEPERIKSQQENALANESDTQDVFNERKGEIVGLPATHEGMGQSIADKTTQI